MSEYEYILAIEENLGHVLQKWGWPRWWNSYIPVLGKTPKKMLADGEYERLLEYTRAYRDDDPSFM